MPGGVFPLSLTLSWRERELYGAGLVFLPLPSGEGRGEGIAQSVCSVRAIISSCASGDSAVKNAE